MINKHVERFDVETVTSNEQITKTYTVAIKIDDNQFVYSHNPTFEVDFQNGVLLSNNKPYVTGIGLYDNKNNLLLFIQISLKLSPLISLYSILFLINLANCLSTTTILNNPNN